MNESHDSGPDGETRLDEMLSHLRSLEPPLETRIANRAAVARELDRLANERCGSSLSWWRRSIRVPLPIAASLAVLMPALFVLQSPWGGEPLQSTRSQTHPAQASDENSGAPPVLRAIAAGNRDSNSTTQFYETEVYLCGVGRLSSESGYVVREQ